MQFGDESSIKIDKTKWLPNEEYHIEDYVKDNPDKNVARPNCLAVNSEVDVTPSVKVFEKAPKYRVNDITLFTDPVTEKDAYG